MNDDDLLFLAAAESQPDPRKRRRIPTSLPVPREPSARVAQAYPNPEPDPSPLFEVRRPARTRRPRPKATELYRLFDEQGILLYVGITMQNAGGRLQQHADTKSWWHLVSRITIQREAVRERFEDDEYEAILNEFPVFNIDGVPWRSRQSFSRGNVRDCMLNRSLIMGMVARTSDAGVGARLRVLEQTEPDVYARVEDWARIAAEHGNEFPLARMMLVRAEERYFEKLVNADWDRVWSPDA